MVWRFPQSKKTVELHRQQNGTAIQRDWSSFLQKHQFLQSWNLEAMERQMYHSLQWRFHKYRALVPNSSLCQSAQCLRSSCELVLSIRDNKCLTIIDPEEVELLVSPPTQAPGNRIQGRGLSFQTMEKKIQLTQLCEKNLLPTSCDCKEDIQKFDRMQTTDGEKLLLCVENMRVLDLVRKPKHCQLFPKGTIIGPVLEVHVVKILDGYGIEVAIQSSGNPVYATYFVISREEERFVNEFMITDKSSGPAMNCS